MYKAVLPFTGNGNVTTSIVNMIQNVAMTSTHNTDEKGIDDVHGQADYHPHQNFRFSY